MESKSRKVSSHRNLVVWQKAVDLVTNVYGYLSPESSLILEKQAEEVARILNGLLTSLGAGARKLSTIH